MSRAWLGAELWSRARDARRVGYWVGSVLELRATSLASIVLASLLSNALMLTGPIFMLQVYDRVMTGRSLSTLVALTGIVIVLFLIVGAIDTVRTRLAVRMANSFEARVAGRLYAASLDQRLLQEGNDFNPSRDLDALRQAVASGGPVALLDVPWVPIYVGLLILLHPLLGWLTLAGAGVICGFAVASELLLRPLAKQLVAEMGVRQRIEDDAYVNAESVRAMGMRDRMVARWAGALAALRYAHTRSSDLVAVFGSSSRAFRYLLQSGVLAAGAYLVIRGEISGGVMIGASLISSRALAPVEQLVGNWRFLLAGRSALKRIQKVLTAEGRERLVLLPAPKRSVSAINMSTGPGITGPRVLRAVSFSLSSGDGLGVIGLSGSGKTSVLRALMGTWPVLEGEVRYDDADRSQYHEEVLGRSIGYLPQQVTLMHGSIAENISRFERGASTANIIAAAEAAGVHELVLSLEDGYETQVGPLGGRLSAGQRQRVGLARALYKEPFLLLLDEPNANLDSLGDSALTHALILARRRGAIVVVVAHRPSALVAMNKVLYIRDGRQADFGEKNTVLAQLTGPSQTPAVAIAERRHG